MKASVPARSIGWPPAAVRKPGAELCMARGQKWLVTPTWVALKDYNLRSGGLILTHAHVGWDRKMEHWQVQAFFMTWGFCLGWGGSGLAFLEERALQAQVLVQGGL